MASTSDATLGAIIDEARKGLAPFKVPRFYTFVDDFPRTVSLKIAKPQIPPAFPISGRAVSIALKTVGSRKAEMSRQYDAIIVGGGHNGLVCGAYFGAPASRSAYWSAGPWPAARL
jgi:hypothetical protein